MKLVKCEKVKGHFYDADKYNGCPHCGAAELKKTKNIAAVVNESLMQPPAAAAAEVDEGTVMMDQYTTRQSSAPLTPDNSEHDATEFFFDDCTTEELLPTESPSERCELRLESKNIVYELNPGVNMIGVGNCGGNVNIDASEGNVTGMQASIMCRSGGESEISPLSGGRVYLNGYYLMTACKVSSGDKITIGGAKCVFLCHADS